MNVFLGIATFPQGHFSQRSLQIFNMWVDSVKHLWFVRIRPSRRIHGPLLFSFMKRWRSLWKILIFVGSAWIIALVDFFGLLLNISFPIRPWSLGDRWRPLQLLAHLPLCRLRSFMPIKVSGKVLNVLLLLCLLGLVMLLLILVWLHFVQFEQSIWI